MPDLVRCRGCRHLFQPDPRNRTRAKYPQVYCSRPACRRKSSLVSKRRYRESSPEDPVKIGIRVNLHRKAKRLAATAAGLERSAVSGSDLSTHGLPGASPTPALEVHRTLVATRALGAAIQNAIDEFAESLTRGGCNGITETGRDPGQISIPGAWAAHLDEVFADKGAFPFEPLSDASNLRSGVIGGSAVPWRLPVTGSLESL